MVKFDGVDVCGGGPTRLTLGPAGEYLLERARVDPYASGSQPIGPLEMRLIVTGRLVASDDESLGELVESVRQLLTDPPSAFEVTDRAGRAWEQMSFVRFEPTGPVEYGRQASMGFRAELVRFLTP